MGSKRGKTVAVAGIGFAPKKSKAAQQVLDHREGPLQESVEQYLSLTGWLWFHDRATNFAHMNNAGFPDIVAVHPNSGAVVFLELKASKGKLSEKQQEWRQALLRHPEPASHYYSVVRPEDFDALVALLDRLKVAS